MSESIISLKQGVGRNPNARLKAPADFVLGRQEHVVIMGQNGAGKSLLVDMITGAAALRGGSLSYHFSPPAEGGTETSAYGNIARITFEDAIGSVENPYYFQQRFNSQDAEASPLLRSLLPPESFSSPLIEEMEVLPLLDKRIVSLSSGEMRRYRLFKHLWQRPRVLIVDNPFIGLDAPMRGQLNDLLCRLSKRGDINLILLLSSMEVVPDYMTHVVEVREGVVQPKQTREDYLASLGPIVAPLLPQELAKEILMLPKGIGSKSRTENNEASLGNPSSDEIVGVKHLSLPIEGGRVLYNDLTWSVKRGEKWALQGRNGAGKSVLLSLITADHPAAYAYDFSLFGRRRGTGESIWDIKRYIGFVSPEFHRAYRQNVPAIEIVASGLNDTVGLYKRPQVEQIETCRFWMRVFGIAHLEQRLFLSLSSGEQRLCLLARAFVKDPDLLILDEPLHGLDSYKRQYVREVIECFCRRPDKTLIMVTHYEEELPNLSLKKLQLP